MMAHFGDIRGRKRMFTLLVLLMAIPRFSTALLPTYHSIGTAAPLLLLLMRTCGGGSVPGTRVASAKKETRQKNSWVSSGSVSLPSE